jgi:uncharacterized protein YgiM (DUF1202 family)
MLEVTVTSGQVSDAEDVMLLYLKRSWIVVLLLFLSACIFDGSEPTPTVESETPSATEESEKGAVSPSPTRPTTTPTLRATAPPTETAVARVKPISNAIFIRSGPGDGFEQIALFYEDETAEVVSTDEFGNWYEIRTEEGQEGWVAASVVELIGGQIVVEAASASPTPRPRVTAEAGTTQLRVTINSAFVRSGPGQDYPVIDSVSGESTIAVLGYARNGSWFHIQFSNGRRGWIGATVTEPVGDWTLDEVDEVENVPPPPPTPENRCDPAYPTVCIPSSPPDLDCRDIEYRSFTVLPPDPHLFDGNENGLGCEPLPASSD